MFSFSTFIIYLSIYVGLVATSFFILSFLSYKNKEKQLYTEEELPSVSIIIPAYNEENSIKETISSILNVDYPRNRFEVIVIDDGSKDATYKKAKEISSKFLKVFKKENGGKGAALNFGIKRAKGKIIVTMDADTFVDKNVLKNMLQYFKDEQVASVTSAMTLYKPKSFLQRIQNIEYMLGLFLRKSWASINAIYITPGAFSAYRKTFFQKHGGFDVGNITEDLEMSLRIQYYNYKIENSPEALAYTIGPSSFKHLLNQRKRWYIGLVRNTWEYRKLFGKKYGDLGLFVMPIAWISIFFSVFVLINSLFKIVMKIKTELLFLQGINFKFMYLPEITKYTLERFLFLLLSNKILIALMIFVFLLGFYVYYAKSKMGKIPYLFSGLILFFPIFALLFGFWWVVSIIYLIFDREVVWR